MARFISDQNKVLGLHESGTFSAPMTGSSFWIGNVTECSIEDEEGIIETHYLGTNDRNFDVMDQGPRDVTVTLTYHPQDMRLVFWAIGSTQSVSGTSTHAHSVRETNTDVWQSWWTSGTGLLNAPSSFTIEDSKQSPGTGRNFVRTVRGCALNALTLSSSQGEKDVVEAECLGQSLLFSSGTTTSVTEQTNKAYLWSNNTITLAGSVLDTVKSVEFEINNNLEGPHYLNGSRDIAAPIPGNREYNLAITLDLDATSADFLYRQYYKGGSSFNLTWNKNQDTNAGSQHTSFYMSGCYIMSMEIPSTSEDVVETTLEIRPETITGSEWNVFMVSGIYGPW